MIQTNPQSISVGTYWFGDGSLSHLPLCLSRRRTETDNGAVVFVIDPFFEGKVLIDELPIEAGDKVYFIDISHEPTTEGTDELTAQIRNDFGSGMPAAVVGVGGGSTLDTAKAVSNLLTNGGVAADYQGWDLVKNPGVFKVGVSTLSGTGAEASRTCVMMNQAKNLKLGMNSPYTVFDALILDPALTATVPREQYFTTGMDTYIHCLESLSGQYRHLISDSLSREAMELCRKVFLDKDMMSEDNRETLMAASFLGGTAIGNSFVGIVHPLSAGLSMVLGTRHCLGNCLVLNVLEEFYPSYVEEFHEMLRLQGIELPKGLCADLNDAAFDALYDASVVHEKPLINALGADFKDILTREKVRQIFEQI